MRPPCSQATLEQPCPWSFSDTLDSTGIPWPAPSDISWPKAGLIIAGCAVGGFIGGIGLAALVTTIIGRRVWDTITN